MNGASRSTVRKQEKEENHDEHSSSSLQYTRFILRNTVPRTAQYANDFPSVTIQNTHAYRHKQKIRRHRDSSEKAEQLRIDSDRSQSAQETGIPMPDPIRYQSRQDSQDTISQQCGREKYIKPYSCH